MTSRFSLYDFLGYIIPGAILLLAVIYWTESVLEFDLVTVGSISGVGQTTLFLIVAYLVGHLMQAFGRKTISLQVSGLEIWDLLTSKPLFPANQIA